MFRYNAIAVAVSGLSALAACSTVSAPERSAPPERALTVQPVMSIRNSSGVDSEGMYRIGRYFQGQMRYDDAVAAYRKALALDPANVEARNALGVVYSIQGLAAEAEQAFKAAIAMSPGLPHLHSNLGYHYLQSGRNEEARGALHEAIRLSPANARAWSHLAAAERNLAAAVGSVPVASSVSTAVTSTASAAPANSSVAPIAAETTNNALAPTGSAPAVSATFVVTGSVPAAPARMVAAPVAPAAASVAPAASDAAVSAPALAGLAVVVPASPKATPAATIAQAIEVQPTAPAAQLVGISPNVWELRPRVIEVAVPATAVPQPLTTQAGPSAGLEIPAWIRFEISNGNGITGLAQSVGQYLRTVGASKPRLTNQRPFDQRRTEIQYVAGMEDWARELRIALDTPADLVLTPKIDRSAQMRLVLGKDFHEIEAVARMRREIAKPVLLAREATRK